VANTYKDTKTKYLTADELTERSYKHRNSIRKIRLNNLLLEESVTELQIAINQLQKKGQ
jgi:hypothetical protein